VANWKTSTRTMPVGRRAQPPVGPTKRASNQPGQGRVEYRGRRTSRGKWIDLRAGDALASLELHDNEDDGLARESSPTSPRGSSFRNKLTDNVLSGNSDLSDDDDDPSAHTGGPAAPSGSPRVGTLGIDHGYGDFAAA